MKIISWNVNGLRAVRGRGFLEWLRKSKADIVCLQEIKAQMNKVPAELINPVGYFSFYNPATRPGYAGTAVFVKKSLKSNFGQSLKIDFSDKLGHKEFDEQGRFLRLDFKDFILINLYLPHGGRGKENLGYKLEVYEYLFKYLKKLKLPPLNLPLEKGERGRVSPNPSLRRGREEKPIVLIGDFNIAHKEIDLARPKQNTKNIMFTAEERAQLEGLVKMGFTDTFRILHPEEKKYTWWPYFANARARNLGWRIDYAFVSKNLASKLKRAEILTTVAGSDHCPIEVEI